MKFASVRNSVCRGCPLWETCSTVCLPTEQYNHSTWEAPTKDRALLIVGEAPGANEDEQGRPFVGAAGSILRKLYVDHHGLSTLADVYITNAVRCRPPGNKAPNKTQLVACQGYYLEDLITLQATYKEVLVLAAGGTAVSSILGMSLKKSFARQGMLADFRTLTSKTKKSRKIVEERLGGRWPEPCRIFTTYHPIYLRREPAVAPAVSAHMCYLRDYMNGTLTHQLSEVLEIEVAPEPPSEPITRLVLDIETYGFGQFLPKQTQFHPLKSDVWDKVPPDKQILTVGITYRLAEQSEPAHAIFVMADATHRRRLVGWLRALSATTSGFLGGHNLPFDIAYLRYCYPEFRLYLTPELPLVDTMILNYLNDEGRPEKSLKALSQVFRITQYDTEHERLYADGWDPSLHQYNCQDTAATDLLIDKLWASIRDFYGTKSPKLSDYSMQWYSDLLWLVIQLGEQGVGISEENLVTLQKEAITERDGLLNWAKVTYDLTLQGTGSEKSKRRIIDDALDALTDADIEIPDLERTETKGLVKYDALNRKTLLDIIPDGTAKDQLELLGKYQDVSGLLDKYLFPLLEGRGKNHGDPSTRLIDGVLYPRWFPVPSEWDDGSAGGTKQARIVAKGPPVQTFPKPVKACIRSRFGHQFLWADYSQIELRISGLLSGDPIIIQEYVDGIDRHAGAAVRLFGESVRTLPNWDDYRQGGKVANFLQLFLGEWPKLQASMMTDLGIWIPDKEAMMFIQTERGRYKVLHRWQLSLLDFVARHGYYELPVLGQSRLFLGGKAARRKAKSEIVNLPIQAEAANVMLSAQMTVLREFRRRRLRSKCGINVYDALGVEVADYELFPVMEVLRTVLPNPPYFQTLCEHLGRTIPLQAEISTYQPDGSLVEKIVL